MAKRRNWLSRIMRGLIALGVVVLVLSVAGKYWLIPAAVRWQLNVQLSKHWAGEATIDEIEFNYFSPSRLRGLSLRDDAGREWLNVGSMTLTLHNFPGLHPILTHVDARDVVVRGHTIGGRLAWPLKSLPQWRGNIDQYVKLWHVNVEPITFVLADDRGNAVVWEDIEFDLFGPFPFPSKRPAYRYSLTRKTKDETQTLVCRGVTFVATSESRVDLAVSHRLNARETESLLAIFNLTSVTGEDGNTPTSAAAGTPGAKASPGLLNGEVHLEGQASDPNTFAGRGRFRLANIRVKHGFGWLDRMLAAAGIDLGNQLRAVDVPFEIRGTRIVFAKSIATCDFGSVSVEPGGWIDLSSRAAKQVDLHVVAVANSDIKNILSKIPIAKWGVLAANKLTRVHVSGRWDDPPDKLTRREPIRNLADGTLEVLRGISGTSLEIGGGAIHTIGELLKYFNGNDKPDKPK